MWPQGLLLYDGCAGLRDADGMTDLPNGQNPGDADEADARDSAFVSLASFFNTATVRFFSTCALHTRTQGYNK